MAATSGLRGQRAGHRGDVLGWVGIGVIGLLVFFGLLAGLSGM